MEHSARFGVSLALLLTVFILATPVVVAADVAKGKEVFGPYCSACHGDTGKGDGPAAGALDPKPRDLTKGDFKYATTDEEMLKFISEGKGAMPGWGDSISKEDLVAVIAYIRSLKQ